MLSESRKHCGYVKGLGLDHCLSKVFDPPNAHSYNGTSLSFLPIQLQNQVYF